TFIGDNTDRLLAMYRELDGKLSAFDEAEEELPEADDKTVKEAYRTITEIAQSMDYGLMDDMLKDLATVKIPDADRKNIDEIEKLLQKLDWDGIIGIANDALGE
ncbi:MAG: hypothetical protein J5574_01820, partial [Lachnospiraceae bacterium]|nr:hypothetical protein [Lachnospiraceae bacterium]